MPNGTSRFVRVCLWFFGLVLVLLSLTVAGMLVLFLAWDNYGIQNIWDASVIHFLVAALSYPVAYYFSLRESKKHHAPAAAMGWALLPLISLIWFATALYLGR